MIKNGTSRLMALWRNECEAAKRIRIEVLELVLIKVHITLINWEPHSIPALVQSQTSLAF
jgi:hypothetical protein